MVITSNTCPTVRSLKFLLESLKYSFGTITSNGDSSSVSLSFNLIKPITPNLLILLIVILISSFSDGEIVFAL